MSEVDSRPGAAWFHVGGPPDEGDPATEKQYRFLLTLAAELHPLLSTAEKTFIEIEGGYEQWCRNMTRVAASTYISRVMAVHKEEAARARRADEELKKAAGEVGLAGEKVLGRCEACEGGLLVMDGPGSYTCHKCGARGFACRRRSE